MFYFSNDIITIICHLVYVPGIVESFTFMKSFGPYEGYCDY